MKTNRILTIVAATVLLMTSCSNDDERMLTIINEDGTCSREMTFRPDQETVTAPLNEPIQTNSLHLGSDWERTWSIKGDSVRHACPMTQQQWDSLMNVWSKQDKPQTGLMLQGDSIARQALQVVLHRLYLHGNAGHHKHRADIPHSFRPLCQRRLRILLVYG